MHAAGWLAVQESRAQWADEGVAFQSCAGVARAWQAAARVPATLEPPERCAGASHSAQNQAQNQAKRGITALLLGS